MTETTHENQTIGIMDPLDAAMLAPGYLPIDSFVLEDEMSGRVHKRTAGEIAELAQTIMDRGQQVPVEYVIRQRADGTGNENVVTKGYGRIAAMRKLLSDGKVWPNGPGVKAILSDRQDQGSWDQIKIETKIDGLAENIHRHNLKHCDVAAAILELSGPPLGMTYREIAKRLGVTPGYISQHLSYSRLIPEVRKEIDNGRLTWRGARTFFKMAEPEQRARLQKLEKDAEKRRQRQPAKATTKGRSAPDKLHSETVTVAGATWLDKPAALAPVDRQIAALLKAILQYSKKRSAKLQTDIIRQGGALANAAAAAPPGNPRLPGKPRAKKQRTTKPVKRPANRPGSAGRSTRRKSETAG